MPPPPLGRGHNRRASILHEGLAPLSPARAALLQGFAQVARGARDAAQRVLSHPLAQPIVPHLPAPVQTLATARGEWASWVETGGVGEFESARVYLARWARIVAEEGERARRRETPPAAAGAESGELGVFELLRANGAPGQPPPRTSRDPRRPVDRRAWDRWFSRTGSGRPVVSFAEMRHEIFRRGLTPGLRKTVWPFLLGVLPWDVDAGERERVWEERKAKYAELKAVWHGVPEVFDREDIIEERHRIDVDCRRTDRTQPLFALAPATPEFRATFTPSTSDIGSQSPSNEHIETLAGILLTYDLYEKQLGYVQGMSDLCSPIYATLGGDEALTFWCFAEVMDRMNFLRDQSGMRKQLLTLQQLIAVMDPELYRHFEKVDGLNLFFCFRWVLIAFKREFPFDDVVRLWEVLWTDYYSNDFVLFVALAVLESHRDVILRYLVEFDEILKYCNELSMTIELDSTLAQAEVLFLSFAQVVADIDRRAAEGRTDVALPEISENLRNLLKCGRES